MAGIDSPEALALIIPGNALSTVLRKRTEPTGRDLILTYIRVKYQHTQWYPMLVQALRTQSLVIIFDGIDEIPQYKEQILQLFTEDLLPKRHRYLLTCRPASMDLSRYKSFTVVRLKSLTDAQNQAALRQQMGGNIFFGKLLDLRKLREAQYKLYHEILAPTPASRRMIANLNTPDLFKNADGLSYDPSMRQRTVDGTRFLQVVADDVSFKSRSIRGFTDSVEGFMRSFDMLLCDQNLRKQSLKDYKVWQRAVQQTAPIPFGTEGDECTAAQKNNLHVTIRLLAYVRSKLTKETITNMTALMWDDIARHTDELLLVAETFQPAFQHAIQVLFASRLAAEISFEPIADPVRYGKHA